MTVFIGCQSARGCGSRWSSWSGTTFLADRRGTSRSCVCMCPPINFAVVCDHLSKACYWFQRATPHSCKGEVLPSRDHLNGIVFRQPWRHRGVPKPAQNIPVYTVAGLTVEQFSIMSLRTYRRNAVQNFTLHYITSFNGSVSTSWVEHGTWFSPFVGWGRV